MRHTPLNMKRVNFLSPVDINGAAIGGDRAFTSLKNYQYAAISIMVGSASSTPAVTLQQAKNVEGSGAKLLGFAKVYRNMPGASPNTDKDLWQEEDVTSDTFDLAANTNYIIIVKGDSLDVDNKFDCIRPNIAAEAGTNLVAGFIDLFWPRYSGQGNVNMPSSQDN